ncbi:MAG: lipopolysaccharide biosynthesis protein [Chloroflexota bacterium]|nr:lipopolysaccharide biosynthesis protein [Chloroflexota bacterium]
MNIGFKKSLNLLTTRLANNGIYAAIDQGVISLSNFGASILLAALVTPTELGAYVLGFLALYFIRGIQNGIIIQPLNTYGAGKERDAYSAYFSAAAVHQVILSTLSAIGAALLGWILTRFGNDTLGPTILVLWFSFFTWQLQEFFRRGFYTRGEVHKAVWISVTSNVVRLGMIVLISRVGKISGLSGLNAIGWGGFVGALVGAWLSRHNFSRQMLNPLDTWRENWRFGRWILGASLADWVVVDLYPILMAGLISFAATGVYQTLQNLVAPIHVLLRAIDTFMTPIMAKAFDSSGIKKIRRMLRWVFLFAGIPVIGLLVLVLIFTPKLLYLLKGETYLPYSDGIYLMAVFYIFLYINRPLQMAFRAVRQGKQIFIANILAMASMLIFGTWFINRWGLYGAIGGQTLNAVIISLFLLGAWYKFTHSRTSAEPSA